MTEAFLIGNANKVLEKLTSLALEEVYLAWGVKNELHKLRETSSSIQAVLKDAEQQQQAKSDQLKDWLEKIEDAFYGAEDVLDEFQIDVLQRKVFEQSIIRKVRNFFSRSNPLAFSFKMAHKIKTIRERLDEIARDKDNYNLMVQHGDGHVMHSEREMTHSFVPDNSDVFGRDGDKENIVQLLMMHLSDHEKVFSVIAIVGIGGLGKTTLAKMVYNDERIKTHFQLRMWVCVSDGFKVGKVIAKVLQSATHGNCDSLEMNELVYHLGETLKEKRFLLILDDVWNEERPKWEEFSSFLRGGGNGSKIIVTTRKQSVASVVAIPAYNLQGLTDDKCLSLFLKWAFRKGQEILNPKLIEIGEKIVSKCKGVPLAVRTLGCMLYSKSDEREWLSVRDNEIWKLEQKDNGILPALRLSYNDLPLNIKQCFAYCSIFPKDSEINTNQLIQMWMAHSLIPQASNQTQELEDIGMNYFHELRSRYFFQDVEDCGFFFTFKMHDLFHDLALLVSKAVHSTIKTCTENISEKVRHVSFYDPDSPPDELLNPLREVKNLRTIYFQYKREKPIERSFVEKCISRFECLRLLDLRESCFDKLPSSIGRLKHLRYLDLSQNRSIKSLPKSLCKLLCLQTLELDGCVELKKLPEDFRYLTNLRFLHLTSQERCLSKKGIGSLNSLRFLWITECGNLEFLFDGDDGMPMQCLAVLGTLLIGNCENLDLMMADEGEMNVLRSLRFFGIEQVPKLVALPQWLQGSFDTLNHIMIEDCPNFTTLLEWMQNLRNLKKLEISYCPKLTSLPEGMNCLASLREIRILQCPELVRRCQRETGEDWHKITRVPDIYLDNIKISIADQVRSSSAQVGPSTLGIKEVLEN